VAEVGDVPEQPTPAKTSRTPRLAASSRDEREVLIRSPASHFEAGPGPRQPAFTRTSPQSLTSRG
jgi:hypothetical protein